MISQTQQAVQPLVEGGAVLAATNQEMNAEVAGFEPSLLGIRGMLAFRVGLLMLAADLVLGGLAFSVFGMAAEMRAAREVLLGLILFSVVVAALAAWAMSGGLKKRIEAVAWLLERTQEGEYTIRTKPSRSDELGLLERRANLLSSSAEVREKRITESAMTDSLTGLPNRALLTNRLDHLIGAAKRDRTEFALALIDLDRFKWVNDTLGHDAGDILLREVARRLKATVRTSDTVARLGGDEFVLLLQGGLASAQAVVHHVLEAMKVPLKLQGQVVDIGLSVGIAVYPEHGKDALSLMRLADAAMYRAKRKQAGQPEAASDTPASQPARNRETLSMVGEMRRALANREFLLEYQPKLDLNTGLIRSLEGLVRWKHPKRGMVSPGEFIPMAEQTGFMRELTRWVVVEGAVFASKLATEGLEVSVSINVSAIDIEHPAFAETVSAIVREHKLEPGRLCLEITESGVLSETENALNNLRNLAKLGVKLSVDDFGTGYSSLSQLQKLPVDELKVDRSFVHGMMTNRGNATIVNSTIELGRQLGLNVVAEGWRRRPVTRPRGHGL
ncbi:MAG: EAL domain-containing protein [Burkholderiaceae bacterium]